jgi:hypothetical protein
MKSAFFRFGCVKFQLDENLPVDLIPELRALAGAPRYRKLWRVMTLVMNR